MGLADGSATSPAVMGNRAMGLISVAAALGAGVWNSVNGTAHTKSARYLATFPVSGLSVTSPVRRSSLVITRVSGFVGKFAQDFVAIAIASVSQNTFRRGTKSFLWIMYSFSRRIRRSF